MNKVGIFKKGKGKFGSTETPVSSNDVFILGVAEGSSSSSSGDTLADGIVSGNGIAWITGYEYEVTPYVFNIDNVQYTTSRKRIILSPANATFDRIDVVAASYDAAGNGTIIVVEGIPALSPLEPILTSYQLKITAITVKLGTTQSDIDTILIYNENTEYATNDNTSGRVNFDETENPYTGLKSIKLTGFKNGDLINFSGGLFNPNSYDVLQLMISSLAKWQDNGTIEVALYSDATLVSEWVRIDGNPNNTNGNTVFFQSGNSSWQAVVVPMTKLLPTTVSANRIVIRKVSLGTDTFYVDLIRLQKDIPTTEPGTGTGATIDPIAGDNMVIDKTDPEAPIFHARPIAVNIPYDNSTSGLVATNVKDAIDEILNPTDVSGFTVTGYARYQEQGYSYTTPVFNWDNTGNVGSATLYDSQGKISPAADVTGVETYASTQTWVLSVGGSVIWTLDSDNVTDRQIQSTGVYASFFGKNSTGSLPTEAQILAGTKQIINSSLGMTFNPVTSASEYGWAAVERVQSGGVYTQWYIAEDNKGTIGLSSLIKLHATQVSVNGVDYDVYIFNYPSENNSNIKISL